MARTLLSELQPDPDVLSQVLAEDLHLPIDGPAHELRRWLPKALFNIAHTWLNQLEEREGHSVEPIPARPPAPRRSRQSGRASSTERLAVPAPARGDRASSAPADSLHGPLLDLSPLALPPRSFPPIGEVVAGSSTARLQQPSTSLASQQSRDRADRARARAERFEAEEQQEQQEQQQVEMDDSSPAPQHHPQYDLDESYEERNQRRPLTAFHPTSALQARLATAPTTDSPVSRPRSACTVKISADIDGAEDQPFSATSEHFSRPSRSGPTQQVHDDEDGYVLPFQLPVKARSTFAAPFVALADRTPAAPTSTSTSRRLPFADRSSAHNSRAVSPDPKLAQTVKLNPFLPSGAKLPSIQFHPATSSPQPASGPLNSGLLTSSAAFAGPSRGVSSPLSAFPNSGMRSSSPLSSLSSSPPPSSAAEAEVVRKPAAPKSTRTYGKAKGKGKRRASTTTERDKQDEQEQEEARPKRRKSAPMRYSPSSTPRRTHPTQPSSAHAALPSPSSSDELTADAAASRPKRRKSEPARYGAWTGWKDMRIKGLQPVGGMAGSEVLRAKTAGGGGGLGRPVAGGTRAERGKRRREKSPSLIPDSAVEEQDLAGPVNSPGSKKPLPPPPRSYGAFTRDPYYNSDDDDSGETIVAVAAKPPGGEC
ncbi:hypothetical protein JCM8097_007596 [Rhodosporidiobolus ruineniae]